MKKQTTPKAFGSARWIWPAQQGRPVNHYLEFRQSFTLAEGFKPQADFFIAADTSYAVWVNDVLIHAGQFPNVPPECLYDVLQVGRALRVGRNQLRISLYVQGSNTFQHRPGEPGLIFALRGTDFEVLSGRTTSWRPTSYYKNGDLPLTAMQLGFTFAYDASQPATRWQKITDADLGPAAADLTLRQRPIPRIEIEPPLSTRIVAQGLLTGTAIPEQPAPAMQHDALAARRLGDMFAAPAKPLLPADRPLSASQETLAADGFYLVIDLGSEETGYVYLDLAADAGTVVDIGHGEHLDDLRVRAWVGNRYFASRYVCTRGRQTFVHWHKRMAGRYLQLHVRGAANSFRLYHASLLPTPYPIEEKGHFMSSDRRQEDIWHIAVRTLRLCMHEHYEDCPWREQALYANDARNQALAGYYVFGEGNFPATSFELLGRGQGDDGWLEMCMPATIAITIPSFTFCWVLAVADHWLYRGNRDFLDRMLPTVRAILEKRIAEICEDLLPCPIGQRYWQFYEWVPGLDGRDRILDGEQRFDAALNFFFILALRAGASLAAASGADADERRWKRLAGKVARAGQRTFWHAEAGAYQSYVGDKAPAHFAELNQALALLAELPGKRAADKLRDKLAEPSDWIETSLSQTLYKYEALLGGSDEHQRAVFEAMGDEWTSMLHQGATSFWEMRGGADEFDWAGSLCHGWSAIPVYFYGAYVLGIRPLEPGFTRFTFDPASTGLDAATGRVMTPHGPIDIEWRLTEEGYEYYYEAPEACHCAELDEDAATAGEAPASGRKGKA